MKDHQIICEMGRRITSARKRLQLSQEELAEKADVSPQMVSTAERGVKAVRPENLLKISKALGVSTDYLLTGEKVNKDYSLVAEKLLRISPKYLFLIEGILDDFLTIQSREDSM
ncbi:helix-turn-helix domain-containing protein [Candidatus Soleaferrea massiliensis]|uniref:helix-turn-helix domain-containing protein n=1 Tax=Candidatus Soleaferrea massiliensis TaxID=1470354 RepID=UPI00058FF6F5|nr:helix-turn-helix transcriptional regulator [Candidatus Soleaferrea massiliensis]